MDLTPAQQAEIEKYPVAYLDPRYKMGPSRTRMAISMLKRFPHYGSFLDVGCGRGELLETARSLGFDRVVGVEPIVQLNSAFEIIEAVAWDIPLSTGSFDIVSSFDVLEHIFFEDQIPTLKEFKRLAVNAVLLSAADFESTHKGVDLHPGRRPYPEWDELIKEVFPNAEQLDRNEVRSASVGWICRV